MSIVCGSSSSCYSGLVCFFLQFEGENAALSSMNPYIKEAFGKFKSVLEHFRLASVASLYLFHELLAIIFMWISLPPSLPPSLPILLSLSLPLFLPSLSPLSSFPFSPLFLPFLTHSSGSSSCVPPRCPHQKRDWELMSTLMSPCSLNL